VATFGLFFFMFIIIKQYRVWVILFISFLTVSISYFIFSIWLGIPLPKGIFGI
jgi:hypothetical protein